MHVRNTCGYYGAERCIISWMRELGTRGYRFDLAIYPHADPSTETFVRAARSAGAEVHVLPRGHARVLSAVASLVRVVRAREVDVIHAHENRSHVVGWAVGAITRRPVVGTMHGYVPSSPKMERMNSLNRKFLGSGRLSALTVPTQRLAETLPRARVMPNAIDADLAAGSLAASSPPDPPIFGVVGRLNPEKGVGYFLDAIGRLPESWRFAVVGTGPLESALREHPQASRVAWLGFREDARELMRGFTALVVPSLSEGVPITLLEAIAQGVPVVATRVGGIPEVLTDGRDARLVPAGDADALAEAMRRAATDRHEATNLAGAARIRFLTAYTTRRIGDELEEIYREVTGARR